MAGLAMAILLLCVPAPVWAQTAKSLPKPVGCVSDFAHVMSPATIAQLNQICGEVAQKTHGRIDVVTVQTTDGEPIEQYAAELQRSWMTGNHEVMVIVAVGQRQRWIAVENGLEPVFSGADLTSVSGAMVPMLRSNDFDGAMALAVKELAARMARHAGVKMDLQLSQGAPAQVPATPPEQDAWLQPLTWGLAVLLLVSLGVWVYASGLGDTVLRKMSRSTGRER